jgi:hypothetical protein
MVKMTGWMLVTKAGKSLRARLLEHPAYASRPKMADEAVKLLAYIASRTHGKAKAKGLAMSHDLLRNRFRGGVHAVRECKNALFELNLLEITAEAIPGKSYTCYVATESMLEVYKQARIEERELLGFNGNLCKGVYADQRRRRCRKAKTIKDSYVRAHEILCCSVEIAGSLADFEFYRMENPDEVSTAFDILSQLAWVDFTPIRKGENASRLFHPLVNFPSNLRKFLFVKNLLYSGEVDIRSCWPTFLAAQLLKLNKGANESFRAECQKWQQVFCDENNNPREIILKESGIAITQEQMKDCLNKYLNGSLQATLEKNRKPSKVYVELDRWFSSIYPLMHKAWKHAGADTLGEKIGRSFETPLMTDERLYEYADQKGVMLYYQYDGFGVFASPDNKQKLKNTLADLCSLMQQISIEKFGVPIVVKQKFIE